MQRSWRSLLSATSRLACPPSYFPRSIRAFASSRAACNSDLSNRPGVFDRVQFDKSIKKNLFYVSSFDIYQGVGSVETKGLYDYGPLGCALQANIVDAWRKHFVLEEGMLEVDCASLTPHEVLKASGHVDRFTDWTCVDSTTGESFRADHLIKDTLESRLHASDTANSGLDPSLVREYETVLTKIDTYTGAELGDLILKYNITSPTTGHTVGSPTPFNLMFETRLGTKASSSTASSSYLRPETAQGQFVNFQKLFEYNQRAIPFASASVGKCYRNEISPRSGLLRVREFLLAEIEHFVDPDGGKRHARFDEVADVKLQFLSRDAQASGDAHLRLLSIGQAVSERMVNNESLGYFLARIQLFLGKCGVHPDKIRFRQHAKNEMAHYATDCWDAELYTSYGWIECVGCADRSAYDLTAHSKHSGHPITATEQLKAPYELDEYKVDIHHKSLGMRFREASKKIEETLLGLDQQALGRMALELSSTGSSALDVYDVLQDEKVSRVTLGGDVISISKHKRTVTKREYVPNVIEPSFGIGRILYALLEHSWWVRNDGRAVVSLPAPLAPVKVLVAPLSRHLDLVPLAKRLASRLRTLGISSQLDDSSTSIGKRYSRMDARGTPLGLTIDFQSLKDQTFTLRERDSLEQVRASEDEICEAIDKLSRGIESWASIASRLPRFEGQQQE